MNAKKTADTANGVLDIKNVIASMKGKYLDILEVKKGKLVYIGNNEEEKGWFEDSIGNINDNYENDGVANRPVFPTDTGHATTDVKAIKFDETKVGASDNPVVVTTESDPNWYSYKDTSVSGANTSNWANIELKDGSQHVWIPRYAYKITKGYQGQGLTYDSRDETIETGTIEIKFLKGVSNDFIDGSGTAEIDPSKITYDSNGVQQQWLVHPAFTANIENGGWDRQLPGFWFAKYELGTADLAKGDILLTNTNADSKNNPTVKPNRVAYGNLNIGKLYSVVKSMSTTYFSHYGITQKSESHMMKGSEWGAVAYLAHSKYGRNGTEVTINNSDAQITGNAGDTISQMYVNGVQNLYNTAKGKLASTTGNLYGIYDMSGGCQEYSANYILNPNGGSNRSTYGGSLVTDGGDKSTKYKTIYKYDSSSTDDNAYINKLPVMNRKGETLMETSKYITRYNANGWFSDYTLFPYSITPFMSYGLGYAHRTNSGIFSYNCLQGKEGTGVTTRSVLVPII